MTEAERERVAIVAWLKQEAAFCRHAQANEPNDTRKLYRMGQKDGLLLSADAIERGAHLPTPTQSTEGER